MQNGEIILYQPNSSVQIEVRMENETVWLTQAQMAQLFNIKEHTITYHIKEIYSTEELEQDSTTRKIRVVRNEGKRNINRELDFYNLDMIISVGYRVNSKRGIQFRQWATARLKDYILKGYAINNRIEKLEKKVSEHDIKILEHDDKIEFFVRTSLPPREGLFFDGQIFDAFEFVKRLIQSAEKSIILIDNYMDDSVLTMMADKNKDVNVMIYTKTVSPALLLAVEKFNAQYGNLSVKQFTFSHDRFLILDEKEIYLIGASLKDLGKKWLAVSTLDADNIPLIMRRLG